MKVSSLFVSSTDQPRARRAGDFMSAFFGVLLLAGSAYVASRQADLDEALGAAVADLPSWISSVFVIGFAVSAVFGLWLMVMAAIRRRWDILGSMVLALAVALAIGLVLARLIDGSWPIVFPEFGDAIAVPRFPVLRVGAVTALVLSAGPHVTRSIRWLGWFFVAVVSISGLGLGLGVPTDIFGAVGIGVLSAAAVALAFGSPAAYPRNEEISRQLESLGIRLVDLAPAPVQTWGARTMHGVDDTGRALTIKVYGSDARDAQVLSRMWRDLWYRDIGPDVPWSRLQQVEHEGLVTVLADAAGVACPGVIVAATSEKGDAVLVTERRGVDASSLRPDDLTDDLLHDVWREVGRLHDAQISPGSLGLAAVAIDDGTPILTGFQSGSLSATEARIALDTVQLLVATAQIVGVDRAVEVAIDGLGGDAIEQCVPYLQVPAIPAGTRRDMDKPGKLIKAIKERVIESTGIDKPSPVRLRRVKVTDIVITLLIIMFAALILRQIAGIDFAEVWETIQGANWRWVLVALVIAQLVLLPYAISLMAVVRVPLPLGPTIVLQSAIQFIGVAVPSAAGRIATNIAYLRKFGMSPTAAVTQGALDGFSMFLVQVAILLVTFALGDVNFGFGSPDSGGLDWALILFLVLVVIVAGIVVIFSVKKVRDQVLQILRQVRDAMSVLVEEPKRAVVLFSSNLGAQVILGITMWIAVQSIGQQVDFAAALAVVVGAVLLGGLAPTPGGVGVQEAVLAAGLVGVGLSSSDATAAAIIYRVVTFALPPFWGAVSLAWLRKNDYV